MRKVPFVIGEYYHIYNRGTDKRDIFSSVYDIDRFFQSMIEFNVVEPIGSIYENSFKVEKSESELGSPAPKLVNIVNYSLNPNHYHLTLEQNVDDGIKKFMHRLGGGYTNFFNSKYKRSGVLFQGRFKSVHVDSNEYLLHLSAYVNLNYKVHEYDESALFTSSFEEYINKNRNNPICEKDIILKQFKSIEKYISFAEDSVKETVRRREFEFE